MDYSVKVLIADRPAALGTGLATLFQQQSDIEVVGTILDPMELPVAVGDTPQGDMTRLDTWAIELLAAVGDTQADVVVVTLPDSGEMPGICSHLLYEYPQLLILALSSARTRACVYRQTITVEPLADLSDAGILTAVRRVKTDSTLWRRGEEAS
jgi:hypothetical protein